MTFQEMIPFIPACRSQSKRSFQPSSTCPGHLLFFACPLFFFGICHNLAIMLSWNDPFLLDFLIVDDSIVVGNGFIMLWLMPAKRERERRSNKKCTSAENEIFQMHFLWDFFGGLQELFLLSSLQMVLQMKHLYCMQPFQASCLDKLHQKLKSSKKEDVSLHFLRFKRSFLWKDFFLMPLSKEATEVCVSLRPDIPVTLLFNLGD